MAVSDLTGARCHRSGRVLERLGVEGKEVSCCPVVGVVCGGGTAGAGRRRVPGPSGRWRGGAGRFAGVAGTGARCGTGLRVPPVSNARVAVVVPPVPVSSNPWFGVVEVGVVTAMRRGGGPGWLPAERPAMELGAAAVPGVVPVGVVDRRMWLTADRLRRDHRPGPGNGAGRCVCCEMVFPCFGRRLAEAGLYVAESGGVALPRRRPSAGVYPRLYPRAVPTGRRGSVSWGWSRS